MTGSEPPSITVRPMAIEDAAEMLRIYDEGIATGHASFAEAAPDWAAWNASHLADCRLVASVAGAPGGRLAGWVALAPTSARPVYRGVCEISVYVADDARGHGVGAALMGVVVAASEAAGIWTMQAGIFPENLASTRLHEKAGFTVIGTRRRVGRMAHGPYAGRWRDVMLMERRSTITGVD